MKNRFERLIETLILFALSILGLCSTCLAGPPGPPVTGPVFVTPVGGTEITIATAVAIAGYGYWKSRN